MGKDTGIQWTERTWNPWVGCHHKSPGCVHCYMFAGMRRFGHDPETVARTKTWGDPVKWNREAERSGKQSLVFTCSWSDFFIEEADPWRPEAWDLIRRTPMLTYQILTKRPERIADHLPADWGDGYPNVWLGVTAENQRYADERMPLLVRVPAAVRFVSAEPLLEAVDLRLFDSMIVDIPNEIAGRKRPNSISWVIIGGESSQGGAQARRFDLAWARSLVSQCRDAGVAAFVKQLGSNPVESTVRDYRANPSPGIHRGIKTLTLTGPVSLRDRHGGDPDEWPEDLRVREMPRALAAV